MCASNASVTSGGKTRQSGIELLRIIAILAIIVYHLGAYTGFMFPTDGTARQMFFSGLSCFGKFGVAIFFLITGYFLCARKTAPQPKKVWPIIRLALFYLLVSIVIAIIFLPERLQISFPPKELFSAFLSSFIDGDYWFIGAYVLLMVISPYVKKMLDALSDREVTRLCLIISLLSVLCGDLLRLAQISQNGLSNFSFPTALIYALIGYTIRRREKEIRSTGWAWLALVAGIAFIMISPVVTELYSAHNMSSVFGVFRNEQSIGTMLASVGCFIIFSRMKWSNKIVNYIASLTLGVYLIHNNTVIITLTAWAGNNAVRLMDILNNRSFPRACATIATFTIEIFVLCCVVEVLRRLAVRGIVKICTIEKRPEQQ